MKRIFNHPPEPATGKRYWRSLEEFADTPEFRERLQREFPQGAAELEGDEVTRRGFMKVMGASVALAGLGLAGCRRPELHIVPYTKGVEWQIPGNALHYATSMPRRGGALPLIATSYNGRPTKLEGNPNVPGFNGSTDIFGQAAVLDVYDPDRSKVVLKASERGKDYTEATWDDFWAEFAILRRDYLKKGGDGLAFLAEPSTSPTRERLVKELQKQFPKAVWAEFDPWATQDPTGTTIYDYANADVIVSLDCDFLGTSEGTVQSIAGFAAGRRRLGKTQEKMSRLYAVEGRFSITGGMADHRLRVPSSQIGAIATLLASKLGAGAGNSFAAFKDATVDAWITEMAKDLQAAGRGKAFVVCGSQQPAEVHAQVQLINQAIGAQSIASQGPSKATTLSELAEQISQGTVKTLFVLGGNPAYNAPVDLGFDGLLAQVDQVIRLGLHVDETSATATTHVPAAHFLESWGDARTFNGTYLCQQPLILPLYDGISELDLLGQLVGLPAAKGAEYIQATFATLAGPAGAQASAPATEQRAQHLLQQMAILEDASSPDKWNDAWKGAWHQFVHDGFLANSAPAGGIVTSGVPQFKEPATASIPPKPLQPGEYELNFVLGNLDDGRYANNGWLQELPDTITKLTWDNAVYLSPKTAKDLKIEILPPNHNWADLPNTDFSPRTTENANPIVNFAAIDPMTAYPMVSVTTPDGQTMELPAIIAPGQADQCLTIALGYGRKGPRITEATRKDVTAPLRVADGAGFNTYLLRTSTTPGFVTGVKVQKLDKTYPLATTQEHNSMEGRGLVREAPLEKYHSDPEFVREIGIDKDVPQGTAKGYQNYESAYVNPPLNSLEPQPGYPNGYQTDRPAWGMVIDLNTCVGCNACVIACQAENNIPVVGKFQVLRGREMAWIRNDRYFASDNPPQEVNTKADPSYLDDPQMLIQPMACQQCEAAPCEPVCPVNATVHNEEGLNVMAYNRCIGTRYCANNCPYKVRRFNFFNYNDRPIQNIDVPIPVLGKKQVGELYLGPLAGKDGPLTYQGTPDSIALQKNPNVSVRMRGVMEKCTYCVQRIEEAKITQLRKSNQSGAGSGDITLPTDSFKVACQQVCPAEAIVFGNLNDKASKVVAAKADERNYGVLAYLGTRPRTTYLGRVRNPNPAMPGAANIGHTSIFEEEPASGEKKGADAAKPANGDHASAQRLNLEELIG